MMGFCLSCFRASEPSYITPDQDERRRVMTEAAEKRLQDQESRGIKDPASVKRQQVRDKVLEEAPDYQSSSEGHLRWQVS